MPVHKYILVTLLGIIVKWTYSQSALLPMQHTMQSWYEKELYTNELFHTSVKPYIKHEVEQVFHSDSIKNIFLPKNDEFKINGSLPVRPIISVVGINEKTDSVSRFLFQHNVGADTYYEWKKIAFGLTFFSEHSAYPYYYDSIIKKSEVVPGVGYAHATSLGHEASFFSGYISYSPNKIFNLQMGSGKHFIGEGYRSVLLSDAAYNYPYFKASARVWKLKYFMLLSNFKDIRLAQGKAEHYFNKFAATHYLNWNVSKWLSIGFFETIVWQAQDGDFYRGLDVNYINPVVFYRPIEYSLGSSDNALIGTNLKFTINKKNILYTQLLLDEFLLKEVRAGKGWWANKFAWQLGSKFFDVFGAKNLFLQGEINLARPFTYAHDTKIPFGLGVQNYAHFNQPLAHPLGANFLETVGIIRYRFKRVQSEILATASVYGADVKGNNMGGNVYNLYSTRTKNYNNKLLQGNKVKQFNAQISVSYLLNYASNLQVFVAYSKRSYAVLNISENINMISFGIRTSLINRYFDY
ncbi:MAG: hypothetical protein HUU48_08250 [Flavobacteriales bacterium]|nr:hypothetical protein [Flavobacteriales bacterium]